MPDFTVPQSDRVNANCLCRRGHASRLPSGPLGGPAAGHGAGSAETRPLCQRTRCMDACAAVMALASILPILTSVRTQHALAASKPDYLVDQRSSMASPQREHSARQRDVGMAARWTGCWPSWPSNRASHTCEWDHACPCRLSLPLDLRHPRHQVADLVAIELSDRGNAVDIPQKVFRGAEERLE